LLATSVDDQGCSVFPILVKRLSFAKPAPIRCIHLQQADRRSPYRSAPVSGHSKPATKGRN
jgi:hypothetical protein